MKRFLTILLCALGSVTAHVIVLAPIVLFSGCQTGATPEAIVYDTLQQAHNVVQAKHALFEIEVREGRVTTAKEREVRQKHVDALRAIRSAAEAASLGMNAGTPEEVDRLVAAYLRVITSVIPPKP
jgi:hypothetical protein